MSVIAPLACPVNVVAWPAAVTTASAVTTDVPTLSEDAAVHPE